MGVSGKCPVPEGAGDYDKKGTAHKPMLFAACACTAATLGICISLIIAHLRRYRSPKEQRQIVRIAFAPVVYAIVSCFEIYTYETAQYIDPIGDMYEAFCLCALFLLYVQFAVPGGTFGNEMFEAVKAAEEGTTLGFDWPQIIWVFVFQYPITELVSVLILEATEAANDFCSQSLSPKYGHLWVMLISSVGVGVAVVSIFRFYGRMKGMMKVRRGLAKLVCFKALVLIRFLQTWIFSLLLSRQVIKPGNSLSYYDIFYGLPNLLTCIEMMLFGLGFWYAYSSTEYSSDAKPRDNRLSLPKAVLDALNPYDFFAGIGRAFSLVTYLQRTGGFKDWMDFKKQAKADKRAKRGQKGQGRYQTIDGMDSLPRPDESHGRADSQNGELAAYGNQQLYQPPSLSPPRYDDNATSTLTAAHPVETSLSMPDGRA
ncbi:hypothetical protein LTR08_000876 [Meristemomyces frigidus]|nr:hypothetical protein LTR08_000876 [Meristemomyces frigidus]